MGAGSSNDTSNDPASKRQDWSVSGTVDSVYKKYSPQTESLIVEQIQQETERLCQRWSEKDFAIRDFKIYTRATEGSSAAASGVFGGLCHTFIIMETESDSYILERVVEGVKLAHLCTHKSTRNAVLMCRARKISVSSRDIARWTQKEAKEEYGLGSNNCIHFAFKFGQKFMSGSDQQPLLLSFFQFSRMALEMIGVTITTAKYVGKGIVPRSYQAEVYRNKNKN